MLSDTVRLCETLGGFLRDAEIFARLCLALCLRTFWKKSLRIPKTFVKGGVYKINKDCKIQSVQKFFGDGGVGEEAFLSRKVLHPRTHTIYAIVCVF
jgi:hypothetical protein